MSIRCFYTQDAMSLWVNDEWLGVYIGVWRICYPNRFILEADLPHGSRVFSLPDGCTIEFKFVEQGRKDDPRNGKTIITFTNCKEHRKWIPQPDTIRADSSVITAFVEFTCEIKDEWTQ